MLGISQNMDGFQLMLYNFKFGKLSGKQIYYYYIVTPFFSNHVDREYYGIFGYINKKIIHLTHRTRNVKDLPVGHPVWFRYGRWESAI